MIVKTPRRKVYEYYKRLEKNLNSLDYLVQSKENYINFINQFKKEYYDKLESYFIEMNTILIIFLFEYAYNDERSFKRLFNKLKKKHMNLIQHPKIDLNFKKTLKNIYYLLKKLKNRQDFKKRIFVFLISKLSKKYSQLCFKLIEKDFLLYKELYKEFSNYEKKIIEILENKKK